MTKRTKSPKKRPTVDLYKRLLSRMPKMLMEKQSRAIDELNRGERKKAASSRRTPKRASRAKFSVHS
jgi:hypothetical protein